MNKFLIEAKLVDGTQLSAITKPYKGTAARQWASARLALQKLIAGRPYDSTHIAILGDDEKPLYQVSRGI